MKNILIKGTIASGKTFHAKQEAYKATGENDYESAVANGRIVYIPLYEGYGYSELIQGMKLSSQGGNISFRLADRQFAELCAKAENDQNNEYAIILDDADRADISSVFGELLYGIEHRGETVTLQSGDKLTVPENLTVIVTAALRSSKDLDYALLRRFDHREYFSDKSVLEDLINNNECDPSALEEYEFYNAVVEQYLADDLRDNMRYYLLGHGWFIEKNEALVYQSMRYRVIPLLEEYVRDGILDMSFAELKMYEKNAETKYSNVSAGSVTDRIIIVRNKKEIKSDSKTRVKELLDDIINSCKARSSSNDIIYGMMSKLLRNSFELSFENRLLDHDILLSRLYLNTNVIKIYNSTESNNPNKTDVPPRGLLVREDDCKNDTLNEYFQYTGGASNSQLYPLEIKINKNEPKMPVRYRYKGNDYVLLTARGGSKNNLHFDSTLFENSSSKCEIAGQPTIYNLVGRIMYHFYDLYLKGLLELRETAEDKENTDNLIKIVEDDIAWLKKFNKCKKYNKDYELAQDIYTTTLTPDGAIIEGLAVFTHILGETVTKIINGERVTAKLEGVYKMEDNYYIKIMKTMNIRQMIFQGPPGTSKTYNARKILIDQLPNKSDDDNANKNELKKYQLTDEIYKKAENGEFDKTFYWDIVQFHPSYGYEDFVRGITVTPTKKHDTLEGSITLEEGKQKITIAAPNMGVSYDTVDKILGKVAKFAEKAKKHNIPVYLIIDEINRANVSSVFGELIYALEYRGEKIATPYLVNGSSELMIPDNLYIIGTMNTADKSIGNIDYAVRRRFIFFPMLPQKNVVENYNNTSKDIAISLFEKTEELFNKYLNEDYNKDDVQVGHTMFLASDETETKYKFIYQVLPILREYYKDGVLVSSSDSNPIMNYLSKFGGSDPVTDEDLWNELSGGSTSAETDQS